MNNLTLDSEKVIKEYSPRHIANKLFDLTDDALEHYLSAEEYENYYDADFTDKDQLEKWLCKLIIKKERIYNEGYELYKTSLRQIIESNRAIPINAYLPGIEEIEILNDQRIAYKEFLLNLWSYLFDEDYVAINGLTYIERIDEEFVNFPHLPEKWKTPKYREDQVNRLLL